LAGLIGEMMKQQATNPEKSDKVGDKLHP